jgi:diguanylate cyclase (GGDEF)-like protein
LCNVNSEKKKIAGFEEGRIFNGYRYVYPMSYGQIHTGSVEVSISMKTIIEQIEQTHEQKAQFILLREQMGKKVFESEVSNYIPWEIDDRFVLDIGISEECILIDGLTEKNKQRIQKAIDEHLPESEAFTIDLKLNNKNSLLTFMPVNNFLNENIAYLFSISNDSRLASIKNSFRIASVIYFLFMAMIIFLSWFYLTTRKNIDRMMKIDQLTKIDTRRFLLEKLEIENVRFNRYNRPFSIIMIDIDHFKRINDTYGHLNGDEVLKKLTALIKNNIRIADTVGRYGGEEFIIMLPETDITEAVKVAENLRKTVESKTIIEYEKITISMGVAEASINVNTIEKTNRDCR